MVETQGRLLKVTHLSALISSMLTWGGGGWVGGVYRSLRGP